MVKYPCLIIAIEVTSQTAPLNTVVDCGAQVPPIGLFTVFICPILILSRDIADHHEGNFAQDLSWIAETYCDDTEDKWFSPASEPSFFIILGKSIAFQPMWLDKHEQTK